MEELVSTQVMQASAAILFGGAMGIFYDVLRAMRHKTKMNTAVLDIIFSLVFASLLLILGMYIGDGKLRIFMAICTFFGFGLYIYTLSLIFLPIFSAIFSRIAQIFKFMQGNCKKINKYVGKKIKKSLQSAPKWFRIKPSIFRSVRENPREDFSDRGGE